MKIRKKLIPIVLILAMLAGCGEAAETGTASAKTELYGENMASVASAVSAAEKTEAVRNDVSDGSVSVMDSASEAPEPTASPETQYTDDAGAEVEVTGAYLCCAYDAPIYIVTIFSHAACAVTVSGSAVVRDAEGNPLGTASACVDVLGPEEESVLVFTFEDVSSAAAVWAEEELSCSSAAGLQPVLGKLTVEQSLNDSGVSLTVTNSGTVSAQFVEACALFFDADNRLIDYDEAFLMDENGELAPGAACCCELELYASPAGSCDHVLVYLSGSAAGA